MTSVSKLKASLALELPAISHDFAESMLREIGSLEPQDFAIFVAAFDELTDAELEAFKTKIRVITSRLSAYKKNIHGYNTREQRKARSAILATTKPTVLNGRKYYISEEDCDD